MPIWMKHLARGFFPSLFCCPSEKFLCKSYFAGSLTLIKGSFQETAVISSYQPEGEKKNFKGCRLTEAWLLLDLIRNHFSAVTHNIVFRQNMNKHVHKLLIHSNATLVVIRQISEDKHDVMGSSLARKASKEQLESCN